MFGLFKKKIEPEKQKTADWMVKLGLMLLAEAQKVHGTGKPISKITVIPKQDGGVKIVVDVD